MAEATSAKALGRNLPISRKQSIEICSTLRGRPVEAAKKYLKEVISMKKPVPMKRFAGGIGHKAGMASGRYPAKAAKHILMLLESAEANAQSKGLSAASLVIRNIKAGKGQTAWRYGRKRSRRAKRTHIMIEVAEK